MQLKMEGQVKAGCWKGAKKARKGDVGMARRRQRRYCVGKEILQQMRYFMLVLWGSPASWAEAASGREGGKFGDRAEDR